MESTKRCPYCAEEILSAAIKCKHCGSNLAGGDPMFAGARTSGVVTTQQTSKPIKVAKVTGWILLSWGLIIYFGNLTGPDAADRYGGAIMFFIGLVVVVSARFARWWKHD